MAQKYDYNEENELPEAFQNEKEEKSSKVINKEKKNLFQNKIIVIVIASVILLLMLIGVIFWFVQDKLGKLQQVKIDEKDLGIENVVSSDLSDYRNIAIFGVDSRDNNLNNGNRSDCLIVASINNNTKEVKLVSIYRDTYVQIEGYGLDKVTHAYSYGSAPLAINTLNTNFDLNIKEFVTVNFDSVAEAVDQLGGISITIESQEELQYLNSYIDETAKLTGKLNAKVETTGEQTLNGVQAVAYSRIRYTAGGDYKRTERMRTVIEAMVNKLKTKNISEMNHFIDFMLPKVYTNITTEDIFALMPSVTSFNITNSIGWPYQTKGITLDKWYGVPVTLESNVTELHRDVFGKIDYTPSETVKAISDKIIQKTGYKQ